MHIKLDKASDLQGIYPVNPLKSQHQSLCGGSFILHIVAFDYIRIYNLIIFHHFTRDISCIMSTCSADGT